MPHVRCVSCGRDVSAVQTRRRHVHDCKYAYCEPCYRHEARRLERSLSRYKNKEKTRRDARTTYDIDRERLEFLSFEFAGAGAGDGDDDLTDVVLLPAEGAPGVKAHRAVLAGRSPVFRAMFESCSAMREAETGVVVMDDMPLAALQGFVGFLYKAEVSPQIMREQSVALLSAADKYGIEALREACEDAIIDAGGVLPHNALPALDLARRHSSSRLRRAVLCAALRTGLHSLPSVYAHYHAFAAKDPALLLDLYQGCLRLMHSGHVEDAGEAYHVPQEQLDVVDGGHVAAAAPAVPPPASTSSAAQPPSFPFRRPRVPRRRSRRRYSFHSRDHQDADEEMEDTNTDSNVEVHPTIENEVMVEAT